MSRQTERSAGRERLPKPGASTDQDSEDNQKQPVLLETRAQLVLERVAATRLLAGLGELLTHERMVRA